MSRARPQPSPSGPNPTGPATAGGPPAGLERLGVPWWAWPPGLLMAGLLAAEVHMGFPGVRAWLPYLVLLPLAAALLWRAGRMRVGVGAGSDGEREVWAGPAHIPTRLIGRTDVVRGEDKRLAMGPQLDPAAFVLHRPWVPAAVRLEVTDPDDPTPYWVVSTRRPEEFLAALRRES